MTHDPHAAGTPEGPENPEEEAGPTGPVVRDKRKVDPQTGQVRQPASPPEADEPAPDTVDDATDDATEDGDVHPDTALAAGRLEDLQRLQAEYVNYKRRVDRDRGQERQAGIASVVESLLPVLDDLHSAREHGELTDGPFAAIAQKLEATLTKHGVERLGEVGEAFDPTVHEALMHVPDAELPEGTIETTVVKVVQPGFRIGERLVRAARVAVADPPSA